MGKLYSVLKAARVFDENNQEVSVCVLRAKLVYDSSRYSHKFDCYEVLGLNGTLLSTHKNLFSANDRFNSAVFNYNQENPNTLVLVD